MPIRSAIASAKILIVWGMTNPFSGGDAAAAIVALTFGELPAN